MKPAELDTLLEEMIAKMPEATAKYEAITKHLEEHAEIRSAVPLREAAEMLGIAYRTAVKWADPKAGGLFKFQKKIPMPGGMRIPLSEIARIKVERESKLGDAKSAIDAARFAEAVYRDLGDAVRSELAWAAKVYADAPNESERGYLLSTVAAFQEWESSGKLVAAIQRYAQASFQASGGGLVPPDSVAQQQDRSTRKPPKRARKPSRRSE